MDGWPKGLNNRLRETEAEAASLNQFAIPASPWLREAKNVDLTKTGRALRRVGYALRQAGFTHSLWSDPRLDFGVLVHEGMLSLLHHDSSVEPLAPVAPYRPVSCAFLNGDVYWSNGEDLGRIQRRQATHGGLAAAPQPAVEVVSDGGLFAGRHQIALTCFDASDTEHGACEVVDVAVEAGQGLRVVFPAPPEHAVRWGVYCSQANSETLYLVREVATSNFQYVVTQPELGRGRVLETQHRRPPLPGQIVRYFNGRLYVARRDTIYFTDPLRYHLTQPSRGMFMFDGDVTLLEPSSGGLFVGGSFGVVYIAGADPYNVSQMAVSSYAPVTRASVRVPGRQMGVEAADVPLWWAQDGILYAGLPDGSARALTQDRLAVPPHRLGAMLHREREGMSHVVSVLRQSDDSVVGAVDSVVAEVRRGCVKLNV
jgi:hypothetical protein